MKKDTGIDWDLLGSARLFVHQRVTHESARRKVHGEHLVGRFNARLALIITNAVGSMWCAYAFAALACIGLAGIIGWVPALVLLLVTWFSQTFLQLTLLSVIMVGQNVQNAHAEERAEADHKMLTLLYKINVNQLAILHLLTKGDSEGAAAIDDAPTG